MNTRTLLLTITLLFASAGVYAGDKDYPGTLFPGKNKGQRIPSLERIYYYYDGEQLEFEPNFEYSALYVTVESEQTHRVWTGTATPDAPSVSAPDLPGTYVITTVTDQGKTFSGYLNL